MDAGRTTTAAFTLAKKFPEAFQFSDLAEVQLSRVFTLLVGGIENVINRALGIGTTWVFISREASNTWRWEIHRATTIQQPKHQPKLEDV